MDKQNAKRAAAMAAATAVGSTGGTIGADAVINNNNDAQNEDVQSVEENTTHTSSSNHGHSSSHVSPSSGSHVKVVSTPENQEPQITEPTNPDIINDPSIETVDPVTPEEPVVIINPIDSTEPEVIVECMYAGPDDPIFNPGVIIIPEPDMYGGPIDDIYNPDDDVLMGMPAIDEDEITPTGEDTIIDDPSADYNPTDSGDVDYMA